MFGVIYNFTVSANTSVCNYMSPTSNVLSIKVPGGKLLHNILIVIISLVPDPVVDITYCMYRNSTNNQIPIQWTVSTCIVTNLNSFCHISVLKYLQHFILFIMKLEIQQITLYYVQWSSQHVQYQLTTVY